MSLLCQSLTIKRNVRVADGQGGTTEQLMPVKVCLGRISPAGGNEFKLAEQYQAQVSHAVYLAAGVEVRLHDIIENKYRRVEVTVHDLTPSVPRFKKVLGMEVLDGS